ncbi:hypothetical protein BU15DRAFT_71644 [Melanogaster broomeanus]|nr:hypothetical protein BU15DRAFT_71644 [Melanogaster broomeanus]
MLPDLSLLPSSCLPQSPIPAPSRAWANIFQALLKSLDDLLLVSSKSIRQNQPPLMWIPGFSLDQGPRTGFLCGHTRVQTWRHIFTGPASAFNKTRRATKPPKGRIHGLQEPNIRNIMYAAVQIYFTLSNEESWATMIGTVDLTDMYYSVVDMIKRKSDERWVKDLMEFWKDEAPGLSLGGPSKRRKQSLHQLVLILRMTWRASRIHRVSSRHGVLARNRQQETVLVKTTMMGMDPPFGAQSLLQDLPPQTLCPLDPTTTEPPLLSPPPTSPPPPQSPSPAHKRRMRAKPAPAPRPPSKCTRKK